MTANPRRSRATGLVDRRGERDALDALIAAVRAGESRVLVVRGDPGIGKTVLVDYLAGRASGADCRVARAAGVQAVMGLAFAGLHQLCAPMLDRAGRPENQPFYQLLFENGFQQPDGIETDLGTAIGRLRQSTERRQLT